MSNILYLNRAIKPREPKSTPSMEKMKDGLLKRGKYYHFARKRNGKTVWRATKQATREMARQWVEIHILQPERQAQMGIKPIQNINFEDFVKKHYLRHLKMHREDSTYQYYQVKFKPVLEFFGHYPLKDITSNLIEDYKARRHNSLKKGPVKWKGERIKPSTINKEVGVIRSTLYFAIKRNFLLENSATSRKVERFYEEEYEPQFISEEDFNQKFLPAANPRRIPNLTELYIFTLYLGLRKNEALSLKWSNVDFNGRLIILKKPKNNSKQKKSRKVPMSNFIYALLMSIRHNIHSDFVFPKSDGSQRKTVLEGFKRVLKRAGLPRMRYHDLRHSFVSMCAAKDISWDKTTLITGHKSYQMYQRYRHFFDKTAREVVDQFKAPSNYNLV